MSRSTTAKKFQKKGLAGVAEQEIYTSAYTAALHLKSLHHNQPVTENVFIIGEQGLHDEIRAVQASTAYTYGLELNGGGYVPTTLAKAVKQPLLPAPSQRASSTPGQGKDGKVSIEGLQCKYVIAGLDFHFSMLKLATAALCLQRPNVMYIATNEDPQLPIGEEGFVFPGAGCVVKAVNTASGRVPSLVCGKPHLHMAKLLFETERIADPKRCLMIGDRLTTDIAFGNGAGCQTLLVLTGCEGVEDVSAAAKENNKLFIPTYIAHSLNALRLLAVSQSRL